MIGGAFRCMFLAVFLSVVCAKEVYKWEKTKIMPIGLHRWRATSFAQTKDKMFLTLVDIDKETGGNGVVGAFNKSSTSSPTLTVFPFQNFYKIKDSDRGRISTPMSVRTDECERLWLLDSAVQNISGNQIKSDPGIHIFNSKNSQLIRSFRIPPTQWTSASFFVNFVVATESEEHDCEKSYGYFADFNRFHLLTYDFLRNKSDLKSHPFFSPDPLIHIPEDYLFNRAHQDLNGVFGLVVEKRNSSNFGSLIFHPLAGTHEFRISTEVLNSEKKIDYKDVEVFKNKGAKAESGVSVYYPETDTIFLAEVNTRKVGVVRLNDPDSPYVRYDMNLTSGHITDLGVRDSKLWVLVDDESEIAIHEIPMAIVDKDVRRSAQDAQKQPGKSEPPAVGKGTGQPNMAKTPSSASQAFPSLAFLVIFLPLFSFL